MRVLNCVFLLAAFAAAVSADDTTEGSMATMTPVSSTGARENKQDDSEFAIQPQPSRAPSTTPSTTPISPTTDSGTKSVEAPSSTPDKTVASSSGAAVAPTAFALVLAVVYAML